jgi:hypothetical protein
MTMCTLGLLTLIAVPALAGGADLKSIERVIQKEPVYATKTPRYCLLVFGPEAKKRVWLVLDGESLYVDRSGNGDLTEPGKKQTPKKTDGTDDETLTFEVGDIADGKLVHHDFRVYLVALSGYSKAFRDLPEVQKALKHNPKARGVIITVETASAEHSGDGRGGRLIQSASLYDQQGLLQFADRAADAPIIHFGGPWQIMISTDKPALRRGRECEITCVVGTPGLGAGTFAKVGYERLIPEMVHPRVEIVYPSADKGSPPLTASHELKGRC